MKPTRLRWQHGMGLALLLAVLASAAPLPGFQGALRAARVPAAPTPTAATAPQRAQLTRALAQLPLSFIENRGQTDRRVAYYVAGRDTSVYFTPGGLTFALTERDQRPTTNDQRRTTKGKAAVFARGRGPLVTTAARRKRYAVKLDFVGANADVRPVGEARTAAVVSYFHGQRDQWHSGVPTYGRLVYHDVWPGIDLVYRGTVNRLKYSFIVKPGADPEQIRLAYRGASAVRLNAAGELEVSTPLGSLHDERPTACQEVNGQRTEVATGYALAPNTQHPAPDTREYGFQVGAYDRSRPLVIDPAVLVYCGYIGGTSADAGLGMAVDTSGNAYVTGYTLSDQNSFPEKVGPDLIHNGGYDAFVAKVNAAGTGLVYCGYIGGDDTEQGQGIAVDTSGNAYVTGYTFSGENSFPKKVGPDLIFGGNGSYDAFVAKVNAAGTGLVYCGYIGGTGGDIGYGIAVDTSGNAYVTGETYSDENSFPKTVGPDLIHNGNIDAFVAKVNAAGTALSYCGYIGGVNDEYGNGIAVDTSGNAYVIGTTNSDQNSFPKTVGPDLIYNGNSDAFVAKVNAAGTALSYCGYIGGVNGEFGQGIAVDTSGSAYVTGYTDSDQSTFPKAVGPDLIHNGNTDAFVAKVNAAGTGLVYCGYIGGANDDYGYGIAVDTSGNAYVTGYTYSAQTSFPVAGGPGLTFNGNIDAFVAKVNAAGTALTYCGYIGGTNPDFGYGIAVDASGNAYVTGSTYSDQNSFPKTVGPSLTFNGGSDAFVAKISPSKSSLTDRGPTSAGRARRFTVVGQDGSVRAVYVVTLLPSGNSLAYQTLTGCPASYDVVLSTSDLQSRTVLLIVVDCSGNVDTWKSPPGGPFRLVAP